MAFPISFPCLTGIFSIFRQPNWQLVPGWWHLTRRMVDGWDRDEKVTHFFCPFAIDWKKNTKDGNLSWFRSIPGLPEWFLSDRPPTCCLMAALRLLWWQGGFPAAVNKWARLSLPASTYSILNINYIKWLHAKPAAPWLKHIGFPALTKFTYCALIFLVQISLNLIIFTIITLDNSKIFTRLRLALNTKVVRVRWFCRAVQRSLCWLWS